MRYSVGCCHLVIPGTRQAPGKPAALRTGRAEKGPFRPHLIPQPHKKALSSAERAFLVGSIVLSYSPDGAAICCQKCVSVQFSGVCTRLAASFSTILPINRGQVSGLPPVGSLEYYFRNKLRISGLVQRSCPQCHLPIYLLLFLTQHAYSLPSSTVPAIDEHAFNTGAGCLN
jgi:hypothetical protein